MKVEVRDVDPAAALSAAIVAELKLDVAPNRVRPLLEAGGGGAPVPLDSCKSLAEQGVLEGSKVLVEVLAPDVLASAFLSCGACLAAICASSFPRLGPLPTHAPFPCTLTPQAHAPHTAIEYLNMGKKQSKIPTKISFTSAAHFNAFAKDGRALYSNGALLATLDHVIAASKVPGCKFMFEDPAKLMREWDRDYDPEPRESPRDITPYPYNMAIGSNPTLLAKYGKLDVLNGGRGVVFYSAEDNEAVLECDGLALNSTVVLLNEAKTHYRESDAKRFAGKGAGVFSSREKLERIMSRPGECKSEPPEVMGQLAGLAVVLIASSPSFSTEASRACAALGIHTLYRDGSGFAVTLHEQPAGA